VRISRDLFILLRRPDVSSPQTEKILANVSVSISLERHHFRFYIISVSTKPIVSVSVSVNVGSIISVSVIVSVTEISLPSRYIEYIGCFTPKAFYEFDSQCWNTRQLSHATLHTKSCLPLVKKLLTISTMSSLGHVDCHHQRYQL